MANNSRSYLPTHQLALISLTIALFTAGAVQANTVHDFFWADFDNDLEGFEGRNCLNPGIPCAIDPNNPGDGNFEHVDENGSSGINPDGWAKATDPSSDSAARLYAPQGFLNALVAGRRVSFDMTVIPDPDDTVVAFDANPGPLFVLEGAGIFLLYADSMPALSNPLLNDYNWTSYDMLLGDTGNGFLAADSWFKIDLASTGPVPQPVAAGDFALVLAAGDLAASFSMELVNDGDTEFDMTGLDNIHVVPVPAALPFLAAGLASIGLARRRKAVEHQR